MAQHHSALNSALVTPLSALTQSKSSGWSMRSAARAWLSAIFPRPKAQLGLGARRPSTTLSLLRVGTLWSDPNQILMTLLGLTGAWHEGKLTLTDLNERPLHLFALLGFKLDSAMSRSWAEWYLLTP